MRATLYYDYMYNVADGAYLHPESSQCEHNNDFILKHNYVTILRQIMRVEIS